MRAERHAPNNYSTSHRIIVAVILVAIILIVQLPTIFLTARLARAPPNDDDADDPADDAVGGCRVYEKKPFANKQTIGVDVAPVGAIPVGRFVVIAAVR